MSKFESKILVDCLDSLIDYRGKTPKKSENGIPTLSAKSVKMGEIFYDRAFYISPETYKKFMVRGIPKKGDVLLTTEAPLGCVARLDRDDVGLAQRLITLRGKNNILDNGYLMYYLMSPIGQYELKNRATGTTVQGIKRSEFEKVLIKLPPLCEQKAIAHILGTLDEKIELNRQINQTLEAMAQALFKSWFVDFDPVIDNAIQAGNDIPEELQARAEKRKGLSDSKKLLSTNPSLAAQFPASFVFNETLGKWIPEGWEVKSLDKLIKLKGGGTPKTSIKEYWNGNIPWFSVVDAPNNSDVFVIDTEKKVTSEGVKNSSTQILREGTTIISARGTVGKCAIVGVPMAMNQSCYGIQNLDENKDIFTYLLVRQSVSNLQNKSHGSVFSTITRDTFNAIEIVVPLTGKAINVFESTQKHHFDKIKSNLFENKTLIKLRERLLPELIRGRVRVKDIMIS